MSAGGGSESSMRREDYEADFVGAPVPPKVAQRRVGLAFPGVLVVSFRFPHPKLGGAIVGFSTMQTLSDSGRFGGAP